MKRVVLLICVVLNLCAVCNGQVTPTLIKDVDIAKMNHWVDSVFDSMSSDERLGQLFMVVANPKTDAENMRKLTRYVNEIKIGGILFSKGKVEEQAKVTNKMQQISKCPLLISLDGEWGLSMRLSGTTRFPKNMLLGAITNDSLITEFGSEVARQCKEMGIHINFAPDADVNSNVDNPVIGLRSFGENPGNVAHKVVAYSKGLEGGNVVSVAKHFPGHGDTSEDSHYTLPTVRRSLDELKEVELYPFEQYINGGFSGIMTGHLVMPALDKNSKLPVSMSRKVVTDLLQNQLGFEGLCFTDALAMKGASTKNSDNPSVLALKAGNDILLSPSKPISDFKAVKAALEDGTLDIEEIEAKVIKVLRYKYIAGLSAYKPITLAGLSSRLNTPHAEALTRQLNAEGMTLLKNDETILPIKGLAQKKIALLTIGDAMSGEFYNTIKRYAQVDEYNIGINTPSAQLQQIYAKLKKYDLIICGVHTVRIPESASLRNLAKEKDMVMAFFTIPYFVKDYKESVNRSKGIVMGYENTPFAQEYAAQLIFGGIGAKGKLPVTIPDMFPIGTGVNTNATRLGYDSPESVGLNPMRMSMIDSIAMEGVRKKAYPGCQVLVAKDGKIVYNKSFGNYDFESKQPVTEESVYDLASCSKATGTLLAVMKAYDGKYYTLNNKISDFVPEMKKSDKENIQIRDILYHQSGIVPGILFYKRLKGTDGKYIDDYFSPVRKEGYTKEMAKGMFISDSFDTEFAKAIRESKLTPKGKYVYSCINFILLKMMVENQLKKPLDVIDEESFFAPLGAWHTCYNPLHKMDTLQIVPTEKDDIVRNQWLRGYVHDEAAAIQGGVSGNAGLFSNANDLAKILQLYLNNGRYGDEQLLSTETVRLFTQSKTPNSRRGLGFDKPNMTNINSSPCGALTPASVYGHTGYTGTAFWVDPDNNMIYIFLSNRVCPTRNNNKLSSLDIRTRIQDEIYKALGK